MTTRTALSSASDTSASPHPTWQEAVLGFKRRLLEHALQATGGNRTQAARALGLPRTYLLRLIRTLRVAVPAAQRPSGR